MSDPFGDDVADFNLDAFLAGVYDNAVNVLTEDRELHVLELPAGMQNPLEQQNAAARQWSNHKTAEGLMDRRVTPSNTPRLEDGQQHASEAYKRRGKRGDPRLSTVAEEEATREARLRVDQPPLPEGQPLPGSLPSTSAPPRNGPSRMAADNSMPPRQRPVGQGANSSAHVNGPPRRGGGQGQGAASGITSKRFRLTPRAASPTRTASPPRYATLDSLRYSKLEERDVHEA